MAISTHINEYDDVNEFIENVSAYDGTDVGGVYDFLGERYPDETGNDDFDMDKAEDDPKFIIRVRDNTIPGTPRNLLLPPGNTPGQLQPLRQGKEGLAACRH